MGGVVQMTEKFDEAISELIETGGKADVTERTESDEKETEEETTALATPSEELEMAIQMERIKEYTVDWAKPGTMLLPVKEVTSAENSPNWVIVLDHPFIPEKQMRFYIPKPPVWDPAEYKWCRILDEYGLSPGSQFHLQQMSMYARYDSEYDEWTLIDPPGERRKTMYRWKKALEYRLPDTVVGVASRLKGLYDWLSGPVTKRGLIVLSGYVGYIVGSLIAAVGLKAYTNIIDVALNIAVGVGIAFLSLVLMAVIVGPPEES